jgi:hypothetical protein
LSPLLTLQAAALKKKTPKREKPHKQPMQNSPKGQTHRRIAPIDISYYCFSWLFFYLAHALGLMFTG